MKLIHLIFLIVFFLKESSAQIKVSDARDLSMGGSAIASVAGNISFTNISPGATKQNSCIRLSVFNKYYISDLSPVFLSFQKSINENTFIKSSIGRVGNKYFSEQFIEAGISKKLFQNFFAGISIDYSKWNFEDHKYNDIYALIPSFFLYAKPLQNFCFGVTIRNPVRIRMDSNEGNKTIKEIESGIGWKVSDKIQFAFSAEMISGQPVCFQMGTDYEFHKLLSFRAGWRSQPVAQTFGFGLHLSTFTVDLGIETNSVLNNTSAISISIPL